MNKPFTLPVRPEGIPGSLKELGRWILWRHDLVTRGDGSTKYAKVPYRVNGYKAASTNPAHWSTFDEVLAAYEEGGFDGIGIVLGDQLHGIDLDDHVYEDFENPGKWVLDELAQEVIDRVEGYAEVSPSGTGLKVFTSYPMDRSGRASEAHGVELYREGRYFAVTGHDITSPWMAVDTWSDGQAPANIDWLIERVWGEAAQTTGTSTFGTGARNADAQRNAGDLSLIKSPLDGWPAERIREEIAPYLDVEMHYDEWVRVGQILHHQFEGDEEGFELWEEIFSSGSKFDEGGDVNRERWDSFSDVRLQGRGPVTLATLIHETAAARTAATGAARAAMLQAVLAAVAGAGDVAYLEEQVCKDIRRSDMSEGEREQIAGAVRGRARELGAPIPLAVARRWVRELRTVVAAEAPDWIEPWVYITDCDKFYNIDTRSELTMQGFRAAHNRFMPMDEEGERARADLTALEHWGCQVVDHKGYQPQLGAVFTMFNQSYVNTYRAGSVPIAGSLGNLDHEVIKVIQEHLERCFPDDDDRGVFLAWLAHNVQFPGVKVRWAPYIHGVPGDGKSFFGELLGAAMGAQNVRPLNSSTLESNFNEWANGSAVVYVEEMKHHGANRYDIMNKLKPVISNSVVEIHPKGKASYPVANVTNYLFLSNYMDGAPTDEGDRRLFFLSTRVGTERAIRLTEEGFYTRLFDTLKSPGEIRAWLLSIDIEAAGRGKFIADGRAPITKVRQQVIELSRGDVEINTIDLIEGIETVGVSKDVISTRHLANALAMRGCEVPKTSALNNILCRLGYQYWGRLRWDGDIRRTWIKSQEDLSSGQVKELLEETRVICAQLD
jgi:hypothetical protein